MSDWGRLSHLFVTVVLANFPIFLVIPAMPDAMVEAVCGGKDECSLAIYLTGFQQAITGLGSVVMMPIIGNLSDAYGRKKLLAIPITLQIIPLAILAWSRTTNFFYAYYAFKTFTDMVVNGGVICLALSFLADSVAETKRVAAFAMLSGAIYGASVCATLAASLLSTPHIFQVAALFSILAAVYMTIFLKDSHTTRGNDKLEQLFLIPATESCQPAGASSSGTMEFVHQVPSPKQLLLLLRSSTIFALAASVCFFSSLGEAGAMAFLMYFLKARFHFNKDNFALLFLITNLGATFSNALLMPFLGHFIGEETLLSFGLFNAFLSMLLQSIAWSSWVPYASASLAIFFTLSNSCIRSIISKQVGSNEQGIAQGCLLGITSLASIISPLIYSPLSALFLSERAPFDFPGFCILCIAFAFLVGLVLSIMIKVNSFISRDSELQQRLCDEQQGRQTIP